MVISCRKYCWPRGSLAIPGEIYWAGILMSSCLGMSIFPREHRSVWINWCRTRFVSIWNHCRARVSVSFFTHLPSCWPHHDHNILSATSWSQHPVLETRRKEQPRGGVPQISWSSGFSTSCFDFHRLYLECARTFQECVVGEIPRWNTRGSWMRSVVTSGSSSLPTHNHSFPVSLQGPLGASNNKSLSPEGES